jgi:hypothetical protein
MMGAIMGDLNVQIPVSAAGPVGPATLVSGRNGELARDHPYVSAVLVVHKPFGGDAHVGHWFVTNSPGAVALSEVFLGDPRDRVWEFADGEGYRMREPSS